jgi:hypothetical protein
MLFYRTSIHLWVKTARFEKIKALLFSPEIIFSVEIGVSGVRED